MKRIPIIVIAALLSAALLAGCTGAPAATTAPAASTEPAVSAAPSETPAEQPTEPAETPADTNVVDSASMVASLGGTNYEAIAGWPEGLPAEVPEFTAGTFYNELSFKMEVQGITAYAMTYKGAAQADIDAYAQALEANGFTINSTDAGGVATSTGMLLKDGGSAMMVVMVSPGEDLFMIEVLPELKTVS